MKRTKNSQSNGVTLRLSGNHLAIILTLVIGIALSAGFAYGADYQNLTKNEAPEMNRQLVKIRAIDAEMPVMAKFRPRAVSLDLTPIPPRLLSVDAVPGNTPTSFRVVLTWTDVTDLYRVDGYWIERKFGHGDDSWTVVGSGGPGQSSYFDNIEDAPDAVAVYRIRGFKGALVSDASNEVSVDLLP